MLALVRLTGPELQTDAESVLGVLAARVGFIRGWVGRSTDDPGLWVLASEWGDVGSYRRAMSSYDVRVAGAQLFAAAKDEPAAFEVLSRQGGGAG